MLTAIPEEKVCCFPDFGRRSCEEGAEAAVAINIKHTFIEFAVSQGKPHRTRSLTDSELLSLGEGSTSDASTDTPSDEEDIADVQTFAQWASPAWGPAEDAFYFATSSDNLLLPLPQRDFAEDQSLWSTAPGGFAWFPPLTSACELAPYFTEQHKTTIMLRNLPNHFKRETFIELLEDEGFEGAFDLVYVPMDFSKEQNLGYAFVNFLAPSDAARCWEAFDGFSDWGVAGDVSCEVVWSDPHQGIAALVERYRNSPVMHQSVPEEWKPAYFVDGAQVPFPEPTAYIKAPKQKNCRSKNQKNN